MDQVQQPKMGKFFITSDLARLNFIVREIALSRNAAKMKCRGRRVRLVG